MRNDESIKNFGNDITVRKEPPRPGSAHPEYKVYRGNYCVRVLQSAEEADDYARKEASKRR